MRRDVFALLIAVTSLSLVVSQGTNKPVILCMVQCPTNSGPINGIFQACAYATPIDNVCDTYTPQQCQQLTSVGLGQGMNMSTCLQNDCYSPFGGGQPFPGYNYPAGVPICADSEYSISASILQVSALPRPLMTTFLGFGAEAMGPEELSEGGRRRKRYFRWEGRDKDNKTRHVHLKYDVTHANVSVINLDQVDLGVRAVHCRPGGWMAVHLETPGAAASLLSRGLEGHYLTGGLSWRCGDERLGDTRHTAILRRVILARRGVHSPSTIHLHTTLADYHHVFEHASVQLSVDAWPAAHVRSVVHPHAMSHGGRMGPLAAGKQDMVMGFWGWVSNACRTVWHGIQTVADHVNEVVKIVETAAKIITVLITGDYDWDNEIALYSLDWNYDAVSKGAKERDLKVGDHAHCSNCYAHLGAGLAFDLHIEDYHIHDVASYLHGDLEVAVHGILGSDQPQVAGREGTTDLGTVEIPTVTFSIGPVPFAIHTSIPVAAGYTFTAMSHASVAMEATVSGGFRYGFQYTPKDGFHYVNDHNFSPTGSLPAAQWDLELAGQIYLLPTLVMTIDHIGGPNVGIKTFVEAVALYQSSGSPCSSSGGAGTKFTVNWGLQLTLGAHLLVQFDTSTQPLEDLHGLLSPADAAAVADMGLQGDHGNGRQRRRVQTFATVRGDGFPGKAVVTALMPPTHGSLGGAVTLLNVTYPPYQFNSVKWPLCSGCLHLKFPSSSQATVALGQEGGGPLFGGVSFSARVPEMDKPGCPNAAGLWVVMQFHEEQGGPAHVEYPYWVGSINHHKQVANPVLAGHNYTLDYIAQVGYYAINGVFNEYNDDFVKFRAEAPAYVLYSLDGPFEISPDNTTLTLRSPDPCVGTLVMARHDVLRQRRRVGGLEGGDASDVARE